MDEFGPMFFLGLPEACYHGDKAYSGEGSLSAAGSWRREGGKREGERGRLN